jgi:hypothetical protein
MTRKVTPPEGLDSTDHNVVISRVETRRNGVGEPQNHVAIIACEELHAPGAQIALILIGGKAEPRIEIQLNCHVNRYDAANDGVYITAGDGSVFHGAGLVGADGGSGPEAAVEPVPVMKDQLRVLSRSSIRSSGHASQGREGRR